MAKVKQIVSFPLLGILWIYQRTLSFDHGPLKFLYPNGYCRFHPTCSEYAREAIMTFGPINGLYLAIKRFLRCHPWSLGGHDPIPE